MNDTGINRRALVGTARQLSDADWSAVVAQYRAGAPVVRVARASVSGTLTLTRPKVAYLGSRFFGGVAA